MMSFNFHHLARAASLCCLSSLPAWGWAQSQTPSTESSETKPQRVVVVGNPLGQTDPTQPISVLSGDRLLLKRGGTLGETLEGLPGVASSGFGPNSQRPVIRGLDGDRVRLLDNAGSSLDASNLSFDHAVSIDPLVVERIEVLRGPASLLYGGNATGGVVNTVDNRIPKERLESVGGRAEGRIGGASSERSLSALLEGGQSGLNWHLDAFDRQTSDLKVPRFTPPAQDGEATEATDRVRNSAAHARGGALGLSYADSQGYMGLSLDRLDNHYGVTVEPDVTIDLWRRKLSLDASRRFNGPVAGISLQASDTRYQHQEVEGSGVVGTTFRSQGQAMRLEVKQAPWGDWQAVWGLQWERMRFEALGEEAFVPGTLTRQAGLFGLAQWQGGAWSASVGGRMETVQVHSDGDAPEAQVGHFGAASDKRFHPASLSASLQWQPSSLWRWTATLGQTERAPAYYELFADGVHVATGAYERGDPALSTERSQHADVGTQLQWGASRIKLNGYWMRFSRYIALDATGEVFNQITEDGGITELPVYAFRSVPAQLWGAEVEATHRHGWAGWTVDTSAGLDWTRGHNRDSGEALPRLAPLRLNLGMTGHKGSWSWGLNWRHTAAQQRVSAQDVPTGGYSMVGASVRYQWRMAGMDALAYLKGDNLGNVLAYNASAQRSIREMAPLPGRAFSVGLRLGF